MDYNPFLPEVRENPYPYYAYLRQHAPVYYVPFGFWVLSRYDDVLYAHKHPQLFSATVMNSAMTGDLQLFAPEAPALLATDPPDHTRLRKLVNRAFTPRRVASLEAHVREVVQDLIARMATRGECDLVRDLSAPLPGIITAELLGVPPERREDFKRWTDDFVRGVNGIAVPPEVRPQLQRSFDAFRAYFQEAIAAARRQPGDNLISDLVRAEEENQTLTAEEVLSLVLLIVLGGYETTTNLIGNAVLALLDDPEMLAKVRTNPALIPNLLEESLRYDAPVQFFFRQTTQAVEVAGTALPAGTIVQLVYGSANRDERKFADPDRFDITRNTEGHMGFGFGIHYCLGAQLARLEAKVALEALLKRFPRLARTEDPITRIESVALRGPKTLPLIVA